MTTYQEQLRHFIQDYATAVFGSNDIIMSLETSYEDKKVELIAFNKNKATTLLSYDFGSNHEVDKTAGEDCPKYYFKSEPNRYISIGNEYEGVVTRIFHMFARYCKIFSVNYVLSDLPFSVANEGYPQKEMAILSAPLSNEYRKVTLANSVPFEYCVEIHLTDGSLFCQMLIESVETGNDTNYFDKTN